MCGQSDSAHILSSCRNVWAEVLDRTTGGNVQSCTHKTRISKFIRRRWSSLFDGDSLFGSIRKTKLSKTDFVASFDRYGISLTNLVRAKAQTLEIS